MQSARSGHSVLPPAGARTWAANQKGKEGEHWAQCARVRRYKQEYPLTERQSSGHQTIVESRW